MDVAGVSGGLSGPKGLNVLMCVIADVSLEFISVNMSSHDE
jgi:hypothetical protein